MERATFFYYYYVRLSRDLPVARQIASRFFFDIHTTAAATLVLLLTTHAVVDTLEWFPPNNLVCGQSSCSGRETFHAGCIAVVFMPTSLAQTTNVAFWRMCIAEFIAVTQFRVIFCTNRTFFFIGDGGHFLNFEF